MEILWMLIVGGIIGWLAGLITGRDVPGGIIGNIIAGFIGAWLGGLILGDWGTSCWWICNHSSNYWINYFSISYKLYFTKNGSKE